MESFKPHIYRLLRWSERYTKTDMVYVGKSTFWLALGQIVGTSSSIILTILFANYLSMEMFGTYKYVLSMAGFLATFSLTGINTVVTRSVPQGYDGTFKLSLLLQAKWTLPQFLLSISLAVYYYTNDNIAYASAFLIVSIFGPIANISNTFNAFLHGKQDFKTSIIYGVYGTVIYVTTMLGVVLFAPSVVWLVAAYYVAISLSNVIWSICTLKKYPPHNPVLRTEDVAYAKNLSMMNLIGSAAQQIDSILLYYLLGPAELAIYTFSTIIPDRLRTVSTALASAVLPKLAEQRGGARESLLRKMTQSVALAVIVVVCYVALAPYVYDLLFPKYTSSIWYSQIYVLSLLTLPSLISLPSLYVQQRERALYIINAGIPIFKIIISIFLIAVWGILGAILARIVNNLLQVVCSGYYVLGNTEVTPSTSAH